jgi:hypothetical protein
MGGDGRLVTRHMQHRATGQQSMSVMAGRVVRAVVPEAPRGMARPECASI